MALSPEFTEFYSSWMAKARSYSASDAKQCFDKFFTLYVLFNRLYAEATFRLARNEQIRLANRDRFPDAQAAKEYLLQYLGARNLLQALNANDVSVCALGSLRRHLREGNFALKLDMVTGAQRPTEDAGLLQRLESANQNTQAGAILEAIYAVRCNLFHGHKGYNPVQIELLQPMIDILEMIIENTYKKLQSDN